MRIGDWAVTPTENLIERDGVAVKLEPRAMDLLVYLARAGSRVVSPDELLRDVWHGRVFDDSVVYKRINQLRKALGDDSQQPRFIATIPKRGYRLVAPVVLEAAPERHELGVWPPSVASPRANARPSSPAHGRRFTIKLRPIAYLSSVAAALAAALLTMTSRDDGTAEVATPPATAPHIVPLTFDGGRKEQPRLSPDGELVAYTWDGPNGDVLDDFDIYVRPIGRDTALRVTTDSADDIAPAWSPDGEKIAFVRLELDGLGASIHEVAPFSGEPRQLIELPAPPISGGGLTERVFIGWLSWSPEGNALIYGEQNSDGLPARIVRLDLETLEKSPLTTPPATPGSIGDFAPSYSPDGTKIAFVRGGSGYSNLDVWIMDADGQAARPLTTSQWSFIRGLGWAANGREVLFTAGNPFDARSYSVPVSGGPPALLPGLGQGDWDVSMAGKRQVFAKFGERVFYMWEIPGRLADDPRTPPKRLRRGSNLVTSPRGDRIAWQWGLAGRPQIWIAAGDGSDERQLTDQRTVARVPQWSRDGRHIAFGSADAGNDDIYVVEVSSGRITPLTTDPSDERNPSYSRDGRWLYFASNRSGEFEIYRMPSSGGEATRVTEGGGRSARESHDGHFLYYHRGTDSATLFRLRLPLDDSEPTALFTAALFGDQRWFLTGEGIYYVDSGRQPTYGVWYFDFATETATPIYEDEAFIGDLTVSSDETRVFFARNAPPKSELWLVEAP